MFQIFRRIGFFRRRWIWALLLIGLFALAGYWMMPWRGAAADLQLVAMRPDGTFAQSVEAASLLAARAAVRDSGAAAGATRGIPLVLGVANTGMRGGQPERLVLSLPRWYRLTAPGLRNEILPDEPLQRYIVEVEFPVVQSGRVPTLLPALDTLWLEPYVPDYWCTSDADSIPQLIPSTPPDTSGIVPVHIYWSFEGALLEERQTGLLTVELPGSMFRRDAVVDITQSDVNLGLPRALRPGMAGLIEGGTRHSECGPPGDPMRIFSALWVTPAGGRLIAVHFGGQPRKEYYDLNRDSIIELEMWDPDGDGDMEAWRSLRVPIPEWMMPEDPITAAAQAAADSARADSVRLADAAAAAARADSLAALAARPLPTTAATPGGPTDLATLSQLLIPGNPATARRLFVPRPARRPAVQDDGPIGQPLGQQPRPAEPVVPPPAPPVLEAPVQEPPREQEPPPEAEPDEEEPEDLIDRVLREAAEQVEDEE